MSYHINSAKDVSGQLAPELSAEIIRAQQPDLVMLQQLGSTIGTGSVSQLAERVGLEVYGPDAEGGCAYLSRYPLSNIHNFPLGYGCYCVRADFVRDDERVHLFNLSLSWDLWQRKEQIGRLLSDQLLNNPSLPCAAIVAGDFGLPLWGHGQMQLSDQLKRSRLPLWRANFPAKLPLWGRDRIYFRGPIHALAGNVIMTAEARKASTHLPLVLTVETRDTREVLKLRQRTRVAAKQPDPVCG
jgi:endonuclease/exonuclease/phosphatase family metal-dependent hydrolase